MLLYANSLAELERMAELLIDELAKVGLRLNAEKTKILHTNFEDNDSNQDFYEISGEFIKILHEEASHRYLGRCLSLSARNRSTIEFDARIRQSWTTFHRQKKGLEISNCQ